MKINFVRKEKGAITVYVILSVVFFAVFIIGMYIIANRKLQSQYEAISKASNMYADETVNDGNSENDGNKVPIYTIEQLEKIGSGDTIYIYQEQKEYEFSEDKPYSLCENLKIDKSYYEYANINCIEKIIYDNGCIIEFTDGYMYRYNNEWKFNANPNEPNVAGIKFDYVTWEYNSEEEQWDEILGGTKPNDWYNYFNGEWANIKTSENGLEAYWVWIPRYAYIPPSSTGTGSEKTIEIRFVGTDVTSNNVESKIGENYIVHPAFTFGERELDGIWVAKYEASSNSANPDSTYGGGNDTSLKVQVKPGVQSWRNIDVKNMFTVCRNIQENGVVTVSSTDGDTHMMKNIEWGAVAILSHSKYGFYENGKTYQVWNNSNGWDNYRNIKTGYAGESTDANSNVNVSEYNRGNGPKASATGNVYGVYDMAGGSVESKFGVKENSIYVDVYSDGGKSKQGDAMAETLGWYNDSKGFAETNNLNANFPIILRGELYNTGTGAGIFAVKNYNGSVGSGDISFRPTLIVYE